MPELSRFLGIVIAMYYREHGPAHFHAIYGDFEATVEIEAGRVNGSLPLAPWRTSMSGASCIVKSSSMPGRLHAPVSRCRGSNLWSEQWFHT